MTIDGQTDAGLLYDATEYLNVATTPLYAQSTNSQTGRARLRAQSITPEIKGSAGRYKIRDAAITVAQVNG